MKGHKNAITDMAWTPDNRRVITASKDCNLIMWDIETQKKMFFAGEKFNRKMAGHFDEVMALAISENGKYMISGGKDRIVRVWDIHNQK
jgi:ribosomal RNA-processing protein 9